MDRRILAELAVNEPATFAGLVATAKAALPGRHVGARHGLTTTHDTTERARPRSAGLVRCLHASASARTRMRPTPRTPDGALVIESTKNPTVKRVARLKQRPEREETGLALMEGPQVVRELIAHAPETVEELYFTSDGFERHPELAEAATAAGIEVEFVTDAVLAAMADTRTPQGVLAVAHQAPVRLRDLFEDGAKLVVVLDEVRDPGNAGTIIRVADAAGARRGDPHRQLRGPVQPEGGARHDRVAVPPPDHHRA